MVRVMAPTNTLRVQIKLDLVNITSLLKLSQNGSRLRLLKCVCLKMSNTLVLLKSGQWVAL